MTLKLTVSKSDNVIPANLLLYLRTGIFRIFVRFTSFHLHGVKYAVLKWIVELCHHLSFSTFKDDTLPISGLTAVYTKSSVCMAQLS